MKRLTPAIIFLLASPAIAWTPTADRQIATRAARLAPRDMRAVIEQLRAQYITGVDRGRAEEASEVNRLRLRQRIESETMRIVVMLRTRQPMSQVVMRLGTLAHLINDANNPFHLQSDAELQPSQADFEHYFEQRMERFPTVFYGLDPRLTHVLDQTFARSASLVPLMSEEYFRGGQRRKSDEFDDRSTAFGVASICYSHALTDLVNVYYIIWREAGGDVRSASLSPARVTPNAP